MTTHRAGTGRRRAFGATDLFWLLFIIGLLISILLPSLARAREIAKRAVCSANLKGLGTGMRVYAYDNEDWFPIHYFERTPSDTPNDHGVRWVGMMGSNDELKITQATSRTVSPHASHASRSLFLLVIDGTCTAKQFICPSSDDHEDELRNWQGQYEVAAQPGTNRFDFRGYNNLSYGYQLPFGPNAVPSSRLDARCAVSADKGPYYGPGGAGLDGTVPDARSAAQPPQNMSADMLLQQRDKFWKPYNSRNHRGEGQNVLFADGHVEFLKRPLVGVNRDNIYTLQDGFSRASTFMGIVQGPGETLGPLTQTDSFIVP